MSQSNSGNKTHDAAVSVAECTRQAAVTPTTAQISVIAAEVTFYRACLASAIANGTNGQQYETALKELLNR